ncbi:MAG TPA: PleD family two-component system response regulator [Rickettsiales bacterium]|nr:PleD family two-component system response regulator [Rickettsiales bacterium]
MTAEILVVDDVPANVKLLEVKLSNEYYDVITAKDGFEAIAVAKKKKPDLILLDVMMPGMDGFETCRKLKEDHEVSHIPVVMVTALSEIADRVRGLEAGADDFLTKPINDIALFARVKSLVRIKVLLDELRLRDKTGLEMGVVDEGQNTFTQNVTGSKILLIDDDVVQLRNVTERMSKDYTIEGIANPEQALPKALEGNYDLFIVSTQLSDMDGLRLASQLKSQEATRNVPVLMLVDEDDTRAMLKGLELGVNDYIIMPVDYNEMAARIKTQIRRKKYQDALKSNYQQTISLAITDALTGLYNRHYLNAHLDNMVNQSIRNSKPLSLMIMDMDHFKAVNDTYGHDMGDVVLKQLAEIIIKTVRSADLAARFGGEEFVVLMPETDKKQAMEAAERIRKIVEAAEFKLTNGDGHIKKTVSIGVSFLDELGDSGQALLKRADEALYKAKETGRNRVITSEL